MEGFGANIVEVCRWSVGEAAAIFASLGESLSETDRAIARTVLGEIGARLGYLAEVGLGYLTLDRAARTLSGGEAQRVALTATLGSSLVNTLYVLDEPSAGLHPRDSARVIDAIRRLRDAHNTVVVVEHDEAFLRVADEVIDIGPGAGRDGGRLVFQGTPDELARCEESLTGAALSGRLPVVSHDRPHRPPQGRLRLEGARLHNLKDLTVEFPLGVLCVVTGVSGSGKSTLVEQTLYPALLQELRNVGRISNPSQSAAVGRIVDPSESTADTLEGRPAKTDGLTIRPTKKEADGLEIRPTGVERLEGAELVDEVVLVDQSPIGRTARSNPVTYIKAFDEVRQAFASTPEAKLRNYKAGHFSFNSAAGGRCPKCQGNGSVAIDMQFLPDVTMTCPECRGTRFRREVLEVKYRGLTIADVLDLTVREAFTFFVRRPRLQKKLQFLKEVGLDYLPLGQPATTLSGGESQRLKLAAHLAAGSRARTLFLLDEPTIGLHAIDVARLLACFDQLLAVGHSLVVIEHHLDVIRAADHVIDLGPEAGAAGGELVACGPPENICRSERSITGRYLRGT